MEDGYAGIRVSERDDEHEALNLPQYEPWASNENSMQDPTPTVLVYRNPPQFSARARGRGRQGRSKFSASCIITTWANIDVRLTPSSGTPLLLWAQRSLLHKSLPVSQSASGFARQAETYS